jgi:hypothetical protein
MNSEGNNDFVLLNIEKERKRIKNIIELTRTNNIIWEKDSFSVPGDLFIGKYVKKIDNKIPDIKLIFKTSRFPYLDILQDKNKYGCLFIFGEQCDTLEDLVKKKAKKYVKYDFLLIEFLKNAKDNELAYRKKLWNECKNEA